LVPNSHERYRVMFYIDVKVFPAAGKQQWVIDKNGMLKCYVKSQAEKGKANQELRKMVSDALHCQQSCVSIVRGLTGRIKRLCVDTDTTYQDFLSAIGLETGAQGALF
jgi:uncharacterized protein YggU (UPF0235/DUF167 family)